MRRQCKDCGGSSFCEHQRRRSQCKDCRQVNAKRAESERPKKGERQKEKEKEKGPKNLGVFLQETRAESKWGEGGAQEQVEGTKEPEIDTCSMNVILTKHISQDADGDKATAGD